MLPSAFLLLFCMGRKERRLTDADIYRTYLPFYSYPGEKGELICQMLPSTNLSTFLLGKMTARCSHLPFISSPGEKGEITDRCCHLLYQPFYSTPGPKGKKADRCCHLPTFLLLSFGEEREGLTDVSIYTNLSMYPGTHLLHGEKGELTD